MTLFADDVHPCHVDNTCHLPVVGTRSTLLPVDWYSQYRRDINSNSSKWQLTESTSGSESRIHQQSSHTALPILRTVGRVLLATGTGNVRHVLRHPRGLLCTSASTVLEYVILALIVIVLQ